MSSSSQAALKVQGVRKHYGETRALESLELQCDWGDIHTIFGENGSGKSTLVKILSGVIPPDGGQVKINGEVVTHFSPQAMRQLGIATVFQEVLVAPNRSVVENIFLGFDGLIRRQISKKERAEVAQETLSRISNTSFDLDKLVGNLPLPQQQLVVIARALVRDPRILILDEATATLDIDDRDTLFAVIRDFVTGGRMVVFISHRMDEVMQLSNKVTVLRNGTSVATVPRNELSVERLLQLILPEREALEHINV